MTKKEWSAKHEKLLKKTMLTSGKPMGLKSSDKVIEHLTFGTLVIEPDKDAIRIRELFFS